MDLYEFLQHVRHRPSMYVRNWSLEELEIMCHGYSTALAAHGVEEFGTRFNEEFREFLWRQYHWGTSLGWARGIRAHAGSDEEAFCRFFELLEAFRRHRSEHATARGPATGRSAQAGEG